MSRQARPRYVLVVEGKDRPDSIRGLKWVLKALIRRHGLKCVDIREAGDERTDDRQALHGGKQAGTMEASWRR